MKEQSKRKFFPTPNALNEKKKTPIALAYAVTTHASQGSTFKNVYSLVGGNMQDRELTYVQLTRGKERTQLYTTKDLAGKDIASGRLSRQMSTSRKKSFAFEYLQKNQEEDQQWQR